MSYDEVITWHDFLCKKGRIVRVNTDGKAFWVEYADKYTGTWRAIK